MFTIKLKDNDKTAIIGSIKKIDWKFMESISNKEF